MKKRSHARRISRVIGVVFLVGVLAAGAGYGYWTLFDYRFSTVTKGQVYRSGAMPPEALLTKVRRYEIRAVIDLRMPGPEVDAERTALAQVGVKHFHLPSDQVPGGETIDAFLEILSRCEYRPVLIHCKHGEGRAVLFSAIYRIEFEGWSNERARRASRLLPFFGSFRTDARKGMFICNYVPRVACFD